MVLKHGKKGAASSARPEETLKQWEARKAAVHRRQVMSKSASGAVRSTMLLTMPRMTRSERGWAGYRDRQAQTLGRFELQSLAVHAQHAKLVPVCAASNSRLSAAQQARSLTLSKGRL